MVGLIVLLVLAVQGKRRMLLDAFVAIGSGLAFSWVVLILILVLRQ